jgi:glycosidase
MPPTEVGGDAGDILNLHRYLIGLRRRHPWLHDARTSALRLENRCYVFQTRHGDDALIVALNLDDSPAPLSVAELTGRPAEVLAGTGAPPQDVVGHTEIAPRGWLILRPR